MSTRELSIETESWPLARPFVISRGVKTTAEVIVVEISDGQESGRGECVPYTYYGETLENVRNAIMSQRMMVEKGITRNELWGQMVPGAARNAIDSALWDLEAKQRGQPVWKLAQLPQPSPMVTAQTISIGSVEDMALAASFLSEAPLIKAKLDASNVLDRVAAVRKSAPDCRLIIDANEAWDMSLLEEVAPRLADLGVEMIEQPLKSNWDSLLQDFNCPITLCADESCHTNADLNRLKSRYDMVNIKLDKAGGLTEALNMVHIAQSLDMKIMIGCMVGTSLAMAPATMLAPFSEYLDLDGPLLLREDRDNGLVFDGGNIQPLSAKLWG
ncbi:MAG: dipeptide epimerase [Rhodospirillaceae bacterium TMED8]|nr:dipeptide epimerase [Magnetovibrio sp.]OUT48982.1 MAG: dipeptide epimerase [Rhodospirillaceae bacterium TMED8]